LTSSAIDCLTQPVQTARQCPPSRALNYCPVPSRRPTGHGRRSTESAKSGVWSGNEATVASSRQARCEQSVVLCFQALAGWSPWIRCCTTSVRCEMIKSRLFRRLDWLRNSERRFPCCGISSILGCWPSRFSSPCQRRGGGAGLLKIIVAAGIYCGIRLSVQKAKVVQWW
jgi:hypothetical protein